MSAFNSLLRVKNASHHNLLHPRPRHLSLRFFIVAGENPLTVFKFAPQALSPLE